jgi:Zn finger protein HypA/HybF involved in hydrogenase expression
MAAEIAGMMPEPEKGYQFKCRDCGQVFTLSFMAVAPYCLECEKKRRVEQSGR